MDYSKLETFVEVDGVADGQRPVVFVFTNDFHAVRVGNHPPVVLELN